MSVKTKKRSSAKKRKGKKQTKDININLLISAVAVCVVIAVIVSVVSLGRSRRTPAVYDFGKEVAQGVDVSEHNGKVDWEKLAEEYDFAFIRVGYRGYGNGKITEDKYARENLKAAEKAGIPVGVYFYTQSVNEKEAQREAAFVLNIVKHYKLELPVVIDFEYPCDKVGNPVGRLNESNLTAQESTAVINAFLDKVQDKGYACGVYASSSVYASRIDTRSLNKSAVIWVADYNQSVSYDVDYDIWQYSERGKSDAVSSKYVDLNYWYMKK